MVDLQNLVSPLLIASALNEHSKTVIRSVLALLVQKLLGFKVEGCVRSRSLLGATCSLVVTRFDKGKGKTTYAFSVTLR